MNSFNKKDKSPHLPRLLAAPLRLAPAMLHSRLLVIFLNKLLSQQLKDGELDFLEHRHLTVKVSDVSVSYNLTLSNKRLMSIPAANNNDLMIQASMYDFLMLATRQEDPDAQVFQRRLIMQGDTELGLELKNFLDGLDIESTGTFAVIESLLHKGLPVYRRLFR